MADVEVAIVDPVKSIPYTTTILAQPEDRSVDDSRTTVVGGWASSMYQYSFLDPISPDDKFHANSATSNESFDASIVAPTDSADEAPLATHGNTRIKKINRGG